MFAAEWYTNSEVEAFDPLSLAPYDWCSNAVIKQYVRPDGHLQISIGGHAEIHVQIGWGNPVKHMLLQSLRLNMAEMSILLEPDRIILDGQAYANFEDFSKSAQNLIIRAESVFGLDEILAGAAQTLWLHYALSTLERWRRDEEQLQLAELAVDSANPNLVYLGKTLERMTKYPQSAHGLLERERVNEVRHAYSDEKATLERLNARANEWQATTQSSKNLAIEAVLNFGRRYPNESLPMEVEDALLLSSAGARPGF